MEAPWAGLLTYGFEPTFRAFPPRLSSGVVADFVAVHSCEGSGGVSPRFPRTLGASVVDRGIH